jgi:DNA repair protein RecO (recombination protein O)
MRSSERSRQEAQPAYVLHSYPFRETSLVVEMFSRNHGRVALMARGARRPKSAVRGVLLAFQPLLLSWFGKSELRTLHHAEWQGGQPQLQGMALICGFYLNELLLRLLPRDDPHEQLFHDYQDTLRALAGANPETDNRNFAAILRRFEKHLLKELGYAHAFEHEAESGQPIDPARSYLYLIERGPMPLESASSGQSGVQLSGKTLLDLAADEYGDPVTLQQSKTLMRTLINHYLGDHSLHTRQLLRDLHQL